MTVAVARHGNDTSASYNDKHFAIDAEADGAWRQVAEGTVIGHKRIVVLEGSYSLLPALGGRADVRVFLTVEQQEQRRRILERNGPEALQAFITRWIPLEQAYFSAYSLPDASCLTLDTSSVQDV